MRKQVYLFSFLLPVIAVFSFSWAPQQEAQFEKQRIGVILPLTGPLAEYGVAVRNGFKMAFEKQPELFQNIDYRFEDSRYDPKLAVSAFRKLTSIDAVSLVYDWGSATGEVLAPIAHQMQFPLVTTSQDPDLARGKNTVVRFANPAGDFSSVLLRWIRKRGHKNIAVVNTELAYLNHLIDGLKSQLNSDEKLTIVDTYNFGDNDFRSTITKLKTGSYDAIGVFLVSGQVSQFYRQAARQNLSVPTFGTDFFESRSEIVEAGPKMEGGVYANFVVEDEFQAAYREQYGNDTHVAYAAKAYDFAVLTGKHLGGKEKKLLHKDVQRILEQTPTQNGQSGTFSFTNSPEVGKYFSFPVVLKTVQDGTIKVVSKI